MKVLVLMHEDLIPPEVVDKNKLKNEIVPWEAEYDVITNLKKLNHKVKPLGVLSDLKKIREAVEEFKPSVVFNMLEEFNGEAIFDQNVVGYLELLGVNYTGCDSRGLMLSRDKGLSKKILTYHRILVPKFQVFNKRKFRQKLHLKTYPLIVKCLNEESSLGISKASIVNSEEKVLERVKYIHENYRTDAIVEEFLEGQEFFVGVIGNERLLTLPVWQLFFNEVDNPNKEIYGESAKFNLKFRKRKGIKTGPSKNDSDLNLEIQKVAKRTYRALGLTGYARIDLRVTSDNKIYVLEANPNPDISRLDDFAKSADKVGLRYNKLLQKILNLSK